MKQSFNCELTSNGWLHLSNRENIGDVSGKFGKTKDQYAAESEELKKYSYIAEFSIHKCELPLLISYLNELHREL